MSQLPPVPFGMKINPELAEYLTAFRRELEDELDVRPERLDGVVYIGLDNPYVYIADDGSQHELVHEGQIADVLRDADRASQLGTLAEVNQNNLFTGTQSVVNPVLLDGEGWTAPTLLNGWVNYGAQFTIAGFRKLPSGLVVVKGLIRDGTTTAGTVLFNLPAGYRPAEQIVLTTTSSNAWARIDVRTNGDIVTQPGVSANWLAINFSFFAEQ